MIELEVVLLLGNYGDHIRRYEIMLPNVYIQHDSEADLFCIRKSGLCDEFEIKTSRSDFLADKKKFVQYRRAEAHEWSLFSWDERDKAPNVKTKYQALVDGDLPVNYFWYVLVEGIATIEEIPEFAGLIVVKNGCWLNIVRQPTKLHKEKMPIEERYKIARKSTYRFWKLKNEQANDKTSSMHKSVVNQLEKMEGEE